MQVPVNVISKLVKGLIILVFSGRGRRGRERVGRCSNRSARRSLAGCLRGEGKGNVLRWGDRHIFNTINKLAKGLITTESLGGGKGEQGLEGKL